MIIPVVPRVREKRVEEGNEEKGEGAAAAAAAQQHGVEKGKPR